MDILKFVKDLISELGVNLNVESTSDIYGEAVYVPHKRCIEINEELLRKSAKERNVKLDEYVAIIIFHELGHYMDEELVEIDQKINYYRGLIKKNGYKKEWAEQIKHYSLKAEQNAWSNAEKLISNKLIPLFTKIKEESLQFHAETVELEMEKERLMQQIKALE
jgi:hypothetical protein